MAGPWQSTPPSHPKELESKNRMHPTLKTALKAIALGTAFAASSTSQAASLTYSLLDVGNFASYAVDNTGQSFSGTGFVGLYEAAQNSTDQFVHLFGLEVADYSRTALEVDISALAGATINSAFLSFELKDGDVASQTVTVTSFSADGTLEYFWNPPDVLASANYTVTSLVPSILDVTGLLQARVNANAGWFGLHLQGSDASQYTYTDASQVSGNPDSAVVRLNVDFTAAVPEVSTGVAVSMFLGAAGLGVFFRGRCAAKR